MIRSDQRVHGDHGWDLLAIAALTGISLLGWQSTFAGVGFWLTAVIATVVAMLVAITVVAVRGGLEVAVLALMLGYYLASGFVVNGIGLLGEGSEAFGVGVRGSRDAWELLLGTHPPVDAEGAVLLAPFLLCWASAGIATALAVRSVRPAVPLIPSLLLFGVVLLLAQPEPVAVLVQGVAFGGVALMWLRIRSLRVEAAEHGRDPAWRARVAAGTVLVLVGAGLTWLLVDDSPGEHRFVLREALEPYHVEGVNTPLDRFRDFTPAWRGTKGNVARKKLLTVTDAPKGMRLRFATLEEYDGSHWRAANEMDPSRTDDRYLRMSSSIDNPAKGKKVSVGVSPTSVWTMPWVPTAGAVQSLAFVEPVRSDAVDHLRYNPAASSAVMTDELEPGDVYSFTAHLPADRLRPSMEPSDLLDEDLYEAAAFLDKPVQAWSEGQPTPIQALFEVAKRLKEAGRYSDGAARGEQGYRPGQTELRLGKEFILAVPSVGNDEQYAAAMALMANRLRIPARVVVGATVSPDGQVRGRDVEAWVEVRIADGSWRTLPTERFMSHRPPPKKRPPNLPLRSFPKPRPPQQQPPQQQPPQQQPQDQERDQDAQPDSSGAWWIWPLLLLLLLAVAAIPGFKLIRRRRRLSAKRVSLRFAGAWLELVDRARDLGVPVPPGSTRPAQARAVDETLTPLAQQADAEIFGANPPQPGAASGYWESVHTELKRVTSERKPWRRVWAWFNPTSLRRG